MNIITSIWGISAKGTDAPTIECLRYDFQISGAASWRECTKMVLREALNAGGDYVAAIAFTEDNNVLFITRDEAFT